MVLILLRCGATVITTTRFPKYAIRKYSREKDFNVWKDRLQVVGLDFLKLQSVMCKLIYMHMRYFKYITFIFVC